MVKCTFIRTTTSGSHDVEHEIHDPLGKRMSSTEKHVEVR